ncbi:two-component system, response regulator YesN [Fictibacillus solisalsi]|uniref:Two-component system, response regulator YesN n=1 Tax=Fictibacillus solisalsi TaxID=459525 RepID=A0A1H0C3T8_9BACL|nr:response regulator [Fictibacillus solisalsi]SDN52457.1 two-component system, response regulator YesN [Fictibacillus solisalsi]
MKVLIADDEFNVRDIIRHLGQWDAHGVTQLLEASNGDDARQIIETSEPELIFTDIKMPGMNGIELIEWLNSISYPGKVVMITGYDDYAFMRKAIQNNSFDYLLKPIEEEAFNATLEKAANAWKEEQQKLLFTEDAKRLRLNQVITAACQGEPADLELAAPYLPEAETYEVTLLSFYQMHQPDAHLHDLADYLLERRLGYAFKLQHQHNSGLVITVPGEWLAAEEWLVHHLDIPVRLVSGIIKSLDHLPLLFSKLQKEMEEQNFRSIQRLDDLEAARRMQDIISYVDHYYMEDITLEKLANRFFFSREHISRKFKQETGMTLSKYLARLKTDQAKYWLRETDESIYSISSMLGYQDEKYFSKLFKKVVGVTPFEYRNRRKTGVE